MKPTAKTQPPRPASRRAGGPGGTSGATVTDPKAGSSRAEGESSSAASDDKVRQALAASSRAEASISALLKAVQDASTGLAGARQANEVLLDELGRTREQLRQSETARVELDRLLPQLVAQRDAAQLALARADEEREQVLNEHDDFLASLLDEHEDELAELRRQHVVDASVQRDAAVAEERARREEQIEHLERRHRGELEALRKQHEGDVATLKLTCRKQAKSERIELERKLVTERTAAEKKRRAEQERELEVARQALAAERAQHLEQMGRLREEYEDRLAAANAEREQAEQRSARLEQAAEAGRAARQRIQATLPGMKLPGDPDEVERLRQELHDVRQQLDALVRERDHSREMLRRLQVQRDEAHRRANELQRSLTPSPASVTTDDQSPGVESAVSTSPAESVEMSARDSELAAALAATDPKKRRSSGGDRAKGKEGAARSVKAVPPDKSNRGGRSLVGYSVSELEPETTTTHRSRR
jgi:chromosome segregation ATPase